MKIFHRDIKAANILLGREKAKLGKLFSNKERQVKKTKWDLYLIKELRRFWSERSPEWYSFKTQVYRRIALLDGTGVTSFFVDPLSLSVFSYCCRSFENRVIIGRDDGYDAKVLQLITKNRNPKRKEKLRLLIKKGGYLVFWNHRD